MTSTCDREQLSCEHDGADKEQYLVENPIGAMYAKFNQPEGIVIKDTDGPATRRLVAAVLAYSKDSK